MIDSRYEKLDRIRMDIQRDRSKVAKLQETIKQKEAKLREAEASQIVADVGALNMSPEQLGEFLALIQSGKVGALLSGQMEHSDSESGGVATYELGDENEIDENTEEIEDEE